MIEMASASTTNVRDMSRWAFTYVGSATLLIDGPGMRLITDPVLDASGVEWGLSRYVSDPAYRYASSLDPGLTRNQIGDVDLVLLSHDQHRDNFDRAGMDLARRAGSVVTTVAGARRLRGKGFENVIGLTPDERIEYACADGVLGITATPARHGHPGTNWLAGDVIGFLLEHPILGRTYITGDTVWFDGLAAIRRNGPIDHLLIHLGAARFGRSILRRWMRWSMDGDEAARLSRILEAKWILPIHYEGWSHYTESRSEISAGFAASGLAERLVWLPRGVRMSVNELGR